MGMSLYWESNLMIKCAIGNVVGTIIKKYWAKKARKRKFFTKSNYISIVFINFAAVNLI